MKLACFGDTTAPPIRRPFSPQRSISRTGAVAGRVAEHRTGVRATGLVLAAPPDDLRDPRLARGRRRRPRRVNVAPATTSFGPIAELRYPSASSLDRPVDAEPVAEEVDDPRGAQHLAGLAAVPARVHADRAADRAGDADVELEPGQPGRRGPASEHRQADRAAGAHRALAGRDLLELTLEQQRDAREPVVGDEQVRSPPEDQQRRRMTPERRGDDGEVAFTARPHEHRGRPADAIGRQARERRVPLDPARAATGSSAAASSSARLRVGVGHGHSPAPRAAASASSSSAQRGDVAAAERQDEVARPRVARAPGRRARPGAGSTRPAARGARRAPRSRGGGP